ncbi:hypothetical protein PUNSTDRAFT_122530 [Punctularia strigosozonata HHB-11173 SS5]|uniref:Uncharacterized protein n=1 Tax=Punctularia strigosozonata (strain HHB-11173) TaxID=741275 RepID=R7S5L3_PUNST|nr:uncharacterized protein PUNSTDRAFT_122530 [Punctularia strigosozonata HHB-11173 SS5]EIN05272.1 hypothetical protein PUNSTDRAFT_122530 [Punctularia strigosozonata HHB-11173 SS5]
MLVLGLITRAASSTPFNNTIAQCTRRSQRGSSKITPYYPRALTSAVTGESKNCILLPKILHSLMQGYSTLTTPGFLRVADHRT